MTAEPELRRAVRGGERLERHEYRQRVRLVGSFSWSAVLVPTLVVSTSVGRAQPSRRTKKQICTTTKRFRGDVEHSRSRFAQQRVERRGVAVEPQVDAAAVAFEVLGEISAV